MPEEETEGRLDRFKPFRIIAVVAEQVGFDVSSRQGATVRYARGEFTLTLHYGKDQKDRYARLAREGGDVYTWYPLKGISVDNSVERPVSRIEGLKGFLGRLLHGDELGGDAE